MKKLLGIVLALMLALSCTAFAEGESTVSTLSATGTGMVMVSSDIATISLGVMEQDADVIQAQNRVNEKIAAIRAALLEAGVESSDINTDSIYIYAEYSYESGVQTVVGYSANNSLSIRTTQIEKVGTLIDVAFAAGANQLNNVQFSKQDTTEAQAQALTIATQDAMRKAQTIADAAGMQLVSIRTIQENESYSYDSGLNVAFERVSAADGAGTNVQAAMISISAKVTIEYEIAK